MAVKRLEMRPEFWSLPTGWTWHITRVIHCLPDDQVDGFRVTLFGNNTPVIEVVHRDQDHACAIALEAAAEVYPSQFSEWKK